MTKTSTSRTPKRKVAATLAMAGLLGGMAVSSPFSAETAQAADKPTGYCQSSAKNLNLTGRMWQDDNKNGSYNTGEVGPEGVEVKLYQHQLYPDHESKLVATTTTKADGQYTFLGLCAGYYSVEVSGELPNGYSAARTTQSTNLTRSVSNLNFALTYSTSKAVATDVTAGVQNFKEMQWAVDGGYFDLGADRLYKPTSQVTRTDGPVFIHRALVKNPEPPGPYATFRDVEIEDPHFVAVTWLVEKGAVHGNASQSFASDRELRREELAVILYGLANPTGYVAPTTAPFNDIPKHSSFYIATSWMKSTGLSTGYSDGSYGYGRAVNRKEMAIFMHRFVEKFGAQFQ